MGSVFCVYTMLPRSIPWVPYSSTTPQTGPKCFLNKRNNALHQHLRVNLAQVNSGKTPPRLSLQKHTRTRPYRNGWGVELSLAHPLTAEARGTPRCRLDAEWQVKGYCGSGLLPGLAEICVCVLLYLQHLGSPQHLVQSGE